MVFTLFYFFPRYNQFLLHVHTRVANLLYFGSFACTMLSIAFKYLSFIAVLHILLLSIEGFFLFLNSLFCLKVVNNLLKSGGTQHEKFTRLVRTLELDVWILITSDLTYLWKKTQRYEFSRSLRRTARPEKFRSQNSFVGKRRKYFINAENRTKSHKCASKLLCARKAAFLQFSTIINYFSLFPKENI